MNVAQTTRIVFSNFPVYLSEKLSKTICEMKKWLTIIVWIGLVGLIGCENPFFNGRTSGTSGKCEAGAPISTSEVTDQDRGFFNPQDSLYYATAVFGIFYRGGLTNPCELVRRPISFKTVLSRKFKIVWDGPKGTTTDRKAARALIRFTDKAYRDDIDVNLPPVDTLRPYPYEILISQDTTYTNIFTGREYKVALRKGYSNLLDEVKCAEVSLSSTKTFDSNRVILENSTTGSWSQRYFFKASDFAQNVQYVVVREKECATCNVPIPTLTAEKYTITKGEEITLSLSGCPVNEYGQGPLEWFYQTANGTKTLMQRYSYSPRNQRSFSPQETTTYFLRCQGEWYCKPQKEVSVTIEVK